ncbi:MAG: hypothetical protein VW546_04195 [Gammaproteobacteria bacterium]
MRIPKEALLPYLGEDFHLEPLKPKSTIRINERKAPIKQKPTVEKLITKSGRLYKLYTAPTSENEEMQRIRKSVDSLKKLSCIPNIVAAESTFILAEYVDGEFPEFKSPDFVSAFARAAAAYHNLNKNDLDAKDFWDSNLVPSVKYLQQEHLIDLSVSKKIDTFSSRHLPPVFLSAFTYGDLTPQNFIVGVDGQLRLIDLGGFIDNTVIDLPLYSYHLAPLLDDMNFQRQYLNAGGPNQMYDHKIILRLIAVIDSAAAAHQGFKFIHYSRFRKRRSRKQLIKRLVATIKELVD